MFSIEIDTNKAIETTKDRIRVWREAEFAKNDIAIQNALIDGDSEAQADAVDYRNYLRDLPQQCDGKTIDELKEILIKIQ